MENSDKPTLTMEKLLTESGYFQNHNFSQQEKEMFLRDMQAREEADALLMDEEKRVKRFKEYFNHAKFWLERDISGHNHSIKSCTFLGKISLDKVQIAKETLRNIGFTEFDGKKGNFIVIDSEGVIGRSCVKLVKVLKKYKKLSFIILNRCEKILENYNMAMVIKHISADAEYYKNESGVVGKCDILPRIVLLGDVDTTNKLEKEYNVVFSGLTEMI
jgi:hypothetical protein